MYVYTKDGICLFDYVMGGEEVDAELVSGFLTAIHSFAREMGWPSGVSLIRSGFLECRIATGEHVFSALVIDNNMLLGHMTEPLLGDLATQIVQRFERIYAGEVAKASEERLFKIDTTGFRQVVDEVLAEFRDQTFELYQKLILIESMYAKVPQKWCIPLIERLSAGEKDITGEFDAIIKKYYFMKKAIQKVNREQAQVWDLFQIPLYEVD